MSKITVRVPCSEPYAYLEAEVNGTVGDAVAKYNEIKETLDKSKNQEAFYSLLRTIVDSDMTKWGVSDDYASLTQQQKDVVQSVKRFYKRLQNGKRDLEAEEFSTPYNPEYE
jgi:hypothetical protein